VVTVVSMEQDLKEETVMNRIQRYLSALCATAALIAVPLASHAVPITYNISAGSAPGFSASWLHAGSSQMGSSGYFANGIKAGMSGSLTLDMANLASTSGQISGTGDFGLGSDTWTLDFLGASANSVNFIGGVTDLLSLNYSLTSGSHSSTGTFYFANRDFNGSISDGPNYIDPGILYLWGNNWINASGGATDRNTFVTGGGFALGLDLYGEAVAAPEPGIAALLAAGLLVLGFRSRLK